MSLEAVVGGWVSFVIMIRLCTVDNALGCIEVFGIATAEGVRFIWIQCCQMMGIVRG